ncbi:histidine kinase [Myroides pelagicus]|uniref:Histidine kinase n=1 Tax=Myroides pelagicus TaxID=270914 RepID=A0A7K1GP95_9FLAO|nr:histidine kinase [Myroides pelagicus]MEC4114635.1 histidine kinase [Myroides pelagicus]MTH30715.1 histidine kinase [Myroides pelagicus]
MALYYDLGSLYKEYDNDKELVLDCLQTFLDDSKKRLKKIENGIEEKEYSKVSKQINALLPSLRLLGIEQAIEEALMIENWTRDEGKTKEVKEIYKLFKLHVTNARKELKKNFEL